jgi:uncharacterized integral membrane protein
MATSRRRSKTKDDERLRKADEQHLRKLRRVQRGRATKAVVLGLLAVLFITFVIQNSRTVEVRFLAWTWSVKLIWVFVVASGLGAVAGFLIGRPGKQIRLHEPTEPAEEPQEKT